MLLRQRKPILAILTLTVWTLGMTTPAMADSAWTEKARKFIDAHVTKMRPLEIAAGVAWWNANTTGKDEDFKKKELAQNRIDEALADKDVFAELKALKEALDKGEIDDKIIARSIFVLYLQYLEKQVEPELLKKIVSKANADGDQIALTPDEAARVLDALRRAR